MSCYLITGCAGFIGSHLTDRLLSDGNTVIGLDNYDPYYDPALKRANIAGAVKHSSFIHYEGDIRDNVLLDNIFRSHRIDAVIHLAAKAGVRPSISDPIGYEDVNVRGTLRILEAMKEHGVRKMIFASSSSVYGNQLKMPFSENDPVDNPISPYAATKKAGELLCHTYAHLHGFHIWCLRFFTVYGPRQRPEMAIAKFLKAATDGHAITIFGDGSMKRDFTYIDDIINGVLRAIDNVKGYEVVNIGGMHAYSLRDLIETIERVTEVALITESAPVPPGDVYQTLADTTKAERLLDFTPQVSLEDGIRAQWKWMNRGFKIYDLCFDH